MWDGASQVGTSTLITVFRAPMHSRWRFPITRSSNHERRSFVRRLRPRAPHESSSPQIIRTAFSNLITRIHRSPEPAYGRFGRSSTRPDPRTNEPNNIVAAGKPAGCPRSVVDSTFTPARWLPALKRPKVIDPTTILLLLVASLAICVMVDFATIGSAISRYFYRRVRAKTLGAIEIDTPPDISVAAANGLIGVGSEVVAAYDAEWDGLNVVAYAISPQIAQKPLGTRFQVLKIDPWKMELRPITSFGENESKPKTKSLDPSGDNVLL